MRFFRQILFAICAILALCGIVVPLVGCGASRTSAARYHDRALLYLHTTPAYEAAVLNLLSNQTSLTVKKLKLAQPLPVPIVTNYYSILSPPMGIGGMILTTNYAFEFQKGHLSSLGKRNWLPMTNGIPEPRAYNEFFHRPSLVTSNGAYQLATQWLGALSVDVAALEQKNPPHIRREPADEMDADGTSSTNWFPGPLFQISWGTNEPPFSWANPIWIRLIGSTKEPLSVTIRDTSFFISPPMVLTNAGELLGPLPLPRKFVTDLFGGEAAYQVVANPARVEVALIEDKGVKNDPPEFVI
ncbi:MAG TPA: hypothetical protein VFM25_04950, partial [Verrucomicrobiae bacterium]|nr:hypothetical protein [Verrucomicrobiae bacterium]